MNRETHAENVARYVADLATRESHALGFLPATVYPGAVLNNQIKLILHNGQNAGFIFHGPPRETIRIYQTAVERDVRQHDLGRDLFAQTLLDALDVDAERITWRCATELESNHFWQRVSGEPVKDLVNRGLGLRDLHLYEHQLPKGAALDRWLEEQYEGSPLHKLAKLQGIEDYVSKILKKRWRRGGKTR